MNKNIVINSIFLAIQLAMIVLAITIKGTALNYILLSAIILCFLFSLLITLTKNGNIFITLALFFTALADVLLLMINLEEKLLSIISFSLAQVSYLIFLSTQITSHKKFWWIFRVSVVVVAEVVTIIILKEKVDALSLISIFYYTNLIINLVVAFSLFKKLPYMAIGFVLFLLCDTLVGLGVAFDNYIFIDHGSWLYKLVFADFNLIWLFYIPSQTLLGLTTWKENPFKSKKKKV